MSRITGNSDENIKARKALIEEDKKHLGWLLDIVKESYEVHIEKGSHPEDALLNATSPIEAYFIARGLT